MNDKKTLSSLSILMAIPFLASAQQGGGRGFRTAPSGAAPAIEADATGFPALPGSARAKPAAKPVPLDGRRERTVDFVWFSGSVGNASGGASPMTVRVEPNPSRQPSVGVIEEFVSGLGEMWRTATWIAAINAAGANRQFVNDHEFLVRVGGHVDGPSAGMLMTVAMLSALRGDELLPGTTMTGTINPDGTCGPVGGIPQKMQGAKAKGYRRFGYPVGLRMAVDMQTRTTVDLMDYGRAVGLEEVREIGTLEEAYEFLTGKKLEIGDAVPESEMALSPDFQREINSRKDAIWAKLQTRLPRLKLKVQRAPRELSAVVAPLIEMVNRAENNKKSFESSGWGAAALLKTIEADVILRFIELQLDFMEPIYRGDLESAAAQVQGLANIRQAVEAFAGEAGNLARRRTIGGRLNALDAMGNYAHALARTQIGDAHVANFIRYRDAIASGKLQRAEREQATQGMLLELNGALLNFALADVLVEYSRELISLGAEEGPQTAADLSQLAPFGRAYTSAGAAALAYFDSIVVKPQADAAGASVDQARAGLSQQETMYPVIQFSNRVAMAAPRLFPGAHEQALFQLALGNQAYLNASALVNKYYSLGASRDAQGALKLENRRMVTLQLDSARARALRLAARCRRDLGFIPTSAKTSFQLGVAQREGNDEENSPPSRPSGRPPSIAKWPCYWGSEFMRFSLLSVYLALFLARLPSPAAAQIPRLSRDPSGLTDYRVPDGWKVSGGEQGGNYVWHAAADSGKPGSPAVLVIALPAEAANVDAKTLLNGIIQSVVPEPEILQSISTPNGDSHFRLRGRIGEFEARLTAFVAPVPEMKRVFVAIFAAPADRHQALGGDALLYAMVNRESPYEAPSSPPAAPPTVPVAGGDLNLQDTKLKNRILRDGAPVQPADLVGVWLQAVALGDGRLYMDEEGSVISGRHGFGHLLELRRDGSYRLTYRYDSVSTGGVNQAQVVETGRYQLREGRQLHLERAIYDAEYVVMGRPSRERKTAPPPKAFLLGMTEDKQALVLYGFPFEYSISTETNAQGESYILEGFRRQPPR